MQIDHCEITNTGNPVGAKCQIMPRSGDASACLAQCTANKNCLAVHAVRAQNPPNTLPYTVNIPYRQCVDTRWCLAFLALAA